MRRMYVRYVVHTTQNKIINIFVQITVALLFE